jgi:glutamate dehydrogenase
MYLASRRLVERGARWLLRHRQPPIPVGATVAFFAVPVARIAATELTNDRIEGGARELTAHGVPAELALRVAALDLMPRALDIAELAHSHGVEVEIVASIYQQVGEQLQLDWLADRIVELTRADRWEALARNALREDAAAQHRRITDSVMRAGSYDAWVAQQAGAVDRVLHLLDDIRTHAVYDFATVSVALRELRALDSKT